MTTTPTPPLALPALPKPYDTGPIPKFSADQMNAHATAAILSDRAGRGDAAGWQSIESAPKDAEALILGFAPDEEGYSLPTREGWWNKDGNCWVVSIDPNFFSHGQPTHWQSLPTAPTGEASCAPQR